MSLSVLVLLFSFAIPILGIGLAGYQEWLKFRAKQQELGASTQDVEETVQALRDRLQRVEEERDALEQRVQNLETIVTSETWDALHDGSPDPSSLPEASDPVEFESPSHRSDSSSTEEQAQALARRLRT
jgi:predicted nuclease with TOPRIM domain